MYLFVFIVLLFSSCASEKKTDQEVVARVNNSVLTKKGLSRLVGDDISGPKTFLHATNAWVEKKLLLRAAIESGLKKDVGLKKQKEAFYQDLLISSFVDIKTKKKDLVSKKEISVYYNNNKKSFVRTNTEILVKHFISETKKEAENIKKTLNKKSRGKKIEAIIEKYKPQTRLLNDALVKDNLVGFVFKSDQGDVVGPKKHRGSYHVFQVLNKHKLGSVRGLELVYNEIQQRLSKKKELVRLGEILDSLYINSDVYIAPEVFK